MKKNILIISAVILTLSLTAFSVVNKNDTQTNTIDTTELAVLTKNTTAIKKATPIDFTGYNFDVGPRFEPITKTAIEKATSLSDFIDAETIANIVDLNSVNIIVIKNGAQSRFREMGYDLQLTAAQIKLLSTLDYAAGFTIRSEFTKHNKETGALESSFSGPHFTIVPQQQAAYTKGKMALLNYIETNSDPTVTEAKVIIKKTRPVKFYFTVTKKGAISNVRLDHSTNYPTIDKKMKALIKTTEGQWTSAKNSKGETVDQELVLSIGVKGLGC